MSDKPTTNDQSNPPLFQQFDEMERQDVPGPAGRSEGSASASLQEDAGDVTRESVVGSEGTYRAPTVPAATTPTTAPVPVTAAPDLLTNREQDERDRE